MFNPEKEFERELGVFENEVNEAVQSFYAEQTIHNVARRDRKLFDAINRHAPFWNLTVRALQSNALIVLGRIFDRDSRTHSISRLLQLASDHKEIFSKAALERRKRPVAGKSTDELIRVGYVPATSDFARLQRYADKQRAIYDAQYKVIRDKFFAHKERKDITAAFASASIPTLERLLVFLRQLHEAFWQLFHNGLKPILRPARRSARQIVMLSPRLYRGRDEQEWITRETKLLLVHVLDPRAEGSTKRHTARNLSRVS